MSVITEKSVKALELTRVAELLARHAVSAAAKEASEALRPADDMNGALLRLRRTGAACDMMAQKPPPGFAGVKDPGASLERARKGGALNTRELLDMAALLRCARLAKAHGESEAAGCLGEVFARMQGNKRLEEKIESAIIGEEEIADHASAELAALRRRRRACETRIRETLNKYITTPAYSRYLQEPIVTRRADRFVVPVKAEHKQNVHGLVHDVSSSGATFFIEPAAVVRLNNEIRELESAERDEIERILTELSVECAGFSGGIEDDYAALVELDCVFARAKLAFEMKASEPLLTEDGSLRLINARHPLLRAGEAVPISVSLGKGYDTLIITGPNTGGKTVALKTVGLLTLMASCGLYIPADSGSETPYTRAVYADIGDDQSIEQSLSTFSSHMSNIVSILAEAAPGSLALFDELGAGTDPVEGAALAVSIIEHMRERGVKIAATTHYAELKTYALTAAGVENASCEFDIETLRPTYRLITGAPGKSNAFAISGRLGLDADIIERAKQSVGTENAAFEDILSRLEAQRLAADTERERARELLVRAREDGAAAERQRIQTEQEREKILSRARAEALLIVAQTRERADGVIKQLTNAKAEDIAALRAELRSAENALSDAKRKTRTRPLPRELRAGDMVRIVNIGVNASVVAPPDKDGQVRLQAGVISVTAHSSELELLEDEKPQKPAVSAMSAVSARPDTECDLRGMSAEEAVWEMSGFIDGAVLSRLQSVTIIHGKGTGTLRAAVHESLRRNKSVKSFRLGAFGEGENGVTIAQLR
ncbi:MAG: endonuclease MutS2 [Oscillospiraceae bacterium]|jgi:DNA mismatch repair protein MutS2|nr:endonuclease MutS2 [Oscillospiraceae bacterium]